MVLFKFVLTLSMELFKFVLTLSMELYSLCYGSLYSLCLWLPLLWNFKFVLTLSMVLFKFVLTLSIIVCLYSLCLY